MLNNTDKYNIYGNKEFLFIKDTVFLGIVGSRSLLTYTTEVLEDLFFILKDLKVCVISGGMYGTDILAHNLSIKYKIPTIIILPCGIEVYRKSSLFFNLKQSSKLDYCLISSYPSDFQARKYTFLERNKVIVDWSDLVLVAQSAEKSGSMFSGNYSLKTTKSTYAIPISLERKQFQGNNILISKGAKIYISSNNFAENFSKKLILQELNIDDFTNLLPSKMDNLCKYLTDYNPSLIEESLLKLILEGKIFYENGIYFLENQKND